jgi:threonine aldolase
MADAEVGDDGFGDDPTVRRLEAAVAERLGKERGLFVPSGTMANQIALRVLAPTGGVVFCGRRQHLVVREGAAAGVNSPAQLVTLDDHDGTIAIDDITAWIDDAGTGWAQPVAVFVEDTHGEVGGRVWPLDQLDAVGALALPVHLDGARLWNAAVASGDTPERRAQGATLVTVCLSKGLGAPIGSVLCGPADLLGAARLERKRLGGTMRQVGVLAAAGLVALERVERLGDDHRRARRLADAAAARWSGSVDPTQVVTNIVRCTVADPTAVIEQLAGAGVLAVTGSASVVRLVTHADVDDDDIDRAIKAIGDVA